MNNLHLIAHNIAAAISVIAMIYTIAILLLNNHKSTVNITLALTAVAVIVFEISHILGVSVSDPVLSRKILMWNLSVIFISMFNYHCVMAALKKEKSRKYMIYFMYILSLGFVAFFIAYPDTFILESVPKMYFPNYYVPGSLHWVMRLIFQVIIPIYFIFELARAYKQEKSFIEKNRIIYFTVGLALGWAFGVLPILPIFNIWTDPMFGVLFPVFFSIPFTYAILQYQLLDIRIIAKKAFLYGIATAITGGFISLLILIDDNIKTIIPQYPFWATPLLSGLMAVGIGVFAWNKLRENDVLKYEFITTVTHKFRTPLTHIKWAAETIKADPASPDLKDQIGYIISSNEKLVELTNILANVSDTENTFDYKLETSDIGNVTKDVVLTLSNEATQRKISLEKEIQENLKAGVDVSRVKFAIQVLIENALNYSHEGGKVLVSVRKENNEAIISVKDNGIGIPHEEISSLFAKFYRGHNARLADTEGMGIGLYVAYNIVQKHNGRIWAESEGIGKGSSFNIALPLIS